ncbi:MAG: tetratricopeptide repeat protein [Proteobacteria bacterium]|nr:tetratricopeptide repeat protein [Pseudomonadota bacterium]
MRNFKHAAFVAVLLASSDGWAQLLPEVPDGAQAVSLLGGVLSSPAPDQGALDRLATAKADYDTDPNNADYIIWYGRRAAYTGDYRRAIEIFSEGIEKHPDDPRMYRHRGHRYVSIREFERAIEDLEIAADLIEGTENEIEPDGLPNAFNIPVSSLHGNIWYHLGLAYYLKQDWDNAYRAYKAGFDAGGNDDNRVSTAHWLYMILQRKGDPEAARSILDAISADMNVIENMSYHNLCLFYKGEISLRELVGDNEDSPTGAAIMYGAANWHYYTGDAETAREMLRALVATNAWSAFGYIAAEVDLAIEH